MTLLPRKVILLEFPCSAEQFERALRAKTTRSPFLRFRRQHFGRFYCTVGAHHFEAWRSGCNMGPILSGKVIRDGESTVVRVELRSTWWLLLPTGALAMAVLASVALPGGLEAVAEALPFALFVTTVLCVWIFSSYWIFRSDYLDWLKEITSELGGRELKESVAMDSLR